MRSDLDSVGLALFVLTMVAAALLVPDLSVSLLGQPVFGAIVGGALILAVVTVLRAQGRRGTTLERWTMALFLFLMPPVYLTSWLRFGDGRGWLWVELAGQTLFGALAVAGLLRWPWLLAVGIGAHGLLWDAWHYGRAPFMPDWSNCGISPG